MSVQEASDRYQQAGRVAPGQGLVAAGIIETACRVGESYGLARDELLRIGGLTAQDLEEPDARLPNFALLRIVQHVVDRSGDRAFGLRFASMMDMSTQGFWGYAFISCLSLRQAFQLLLRFSSLRHNAALSLREEGEWIVYEWKNDPSIPPALEVVASDAFLACFCHGRRRWLQGAGTEMQVTLTCAEEPHHEQLRALVAGPVTFNARRNQIRIPRRELDLPSRGKDFQLLRLCMMQLERQLTRGDAGGRAQDLALRVRELLRSQLQDGISLEQVARVLKLSARTLRRRLDAAGVSFIDLLERVRQDVAIEYLTQSADDIAGIAERVGYGDPSNFRRAFRRWTGQSPAAFRAQHQSPRVSVVKG